MNQESECYYHYTSVAGCLGILESRAIWLTDYRYLNDRMELHQGLNSLLLKFPHNHQESFKRAFKWHDIQNHHCVLSLSRSSTILSQWRAYASDGAGMALGLNNTFLEFAGLSLVECCYMNHDEYASKLAIKHKKFILEVHSASERIQAENSFMDWVRENKSGFYALIVDLIAIKNPAFTEEQEVRAIWSRPYRDNAIKMREARNIIIPYVEAKIWPEDEGRENLAVVVPEIWLGPKCSDLNRQSIHAMQIGMCMVYRHDCGYV